MSTESGQRKLHNEITLKKIEKNDIFIVQAPIGLKLIQEIILLFCHKCIVTAKEYYFPLSCHCFPNCQPDSNGKYFNKPLFFGPA